MPSANVKRGRSHLRALQVLLALALVSGSASGQERRAVKISQTEGGFGGQLIDRAHFGSSLAWLGDLDGDGTSDLAVGAPHDVQGPESGPGGIWILFLNPDGTVRDERRITLPSSEIGLSVTSIGDLDQDRLPELAISDVRLGTNWILFLQSDGTFRQHARIHNPGRQRHVAAIGDVNGDSIPDLLSQSPVDASTGSQLSYILLLREDGQPRWVRPLGHIGQFCEGAGDVNQDTVPDIVCSERTWRAPVFDDDIRLHFLDTDGSIRSTSVIDLQGPNARLDLSISSTLYDGRIPIVLFPISQAERATGVVDRIVLRPGGMFEHRQRLGVGLEQLHEGLDLQDTFGSSAAWIGDLDGNGLPEIAIGARLDDDGGIDRGAVWILFNEPFPPPTMTFSEIGQATVDKDVRIKHGIFWVNGVDEARLHFRRGGDPRFFSGEMTAVDDTTFVYDIQGFIAGSRGIEYFVETRSPHGVTGRWPDSTSASIPVRLPGGVSFAAPSGEEASGYRLVTFPLDLENSDAASVLEDDLGPYDVKRWRFFQWLPTTFSNRGPGRAGTGSLFEHDSTRPITIRPGTSYWLLVKNAGRRVGSGSGATVPTAEPFVLPTGYGYHFIANPFAFDLPVDQVTSSSERIVRTATDLDALGLIDMLAFADGEFVPVGDTLKAFEGYALYVDGCYDADLQCSENTSGALHLYANREAVPASPSKTVQQQEADWAITIAAVQGQARDRFNHAAVSAGASADWDPLDRPEPPVIGNYVSVSFPHPEWHRPAARFRQDARPVPEEGDVWHFEVRSQTTDPVRLSFTGLETVPTQFDVILIDEAANIQRDLRQAPEYVVTGPGEGGSIKLKLAVGTASYHEARELLSPSGQDGGPPLTVYPNPFEGSTSIRFELEVPGPVSVSVYDILGRAVRRLLSGEVREKGAHVLVWDGAGQDQQSLASGLYFVIVESADSRYSEAAIHVR